jgi:hypothetical protein
VGVVGEGVGGIERVSDVPLSLQLSRHEQAARAARVTMSGTVERNEGLEPFPPPPPTALPPPPPQGQLKPPQVAPSGPPIVKAVLRKEMKYHLDVFPMPATVVHPAAHRSAQACRLCYAMLCHAMLCWLLAPPLHLLPTPFFSNPRHSLFPFYPPSQPPHLYSCRSPLTILTHTTPTHPPTHPQILHGQRATAHRPP